jgi:hypothetical protein
VNLPCSFSTSQSAFALSHRISMSGYNFGEGQDFGESSRYFRNWPVWGRLYRKPGFKEGEPRGAQGPIRRKLRYIEPCYRIS